MALGCAPYCTDYYINQRLNLKMDLPLRRDTILNLFDRVRKDFPGMDRLRRYEHELALETAADDEALAQWLAVRKTSVRTGVANPEELESALSLHRLALEIAPYYLDVTALDVDHLEMLFGFDLYAPGNHDAIVCRALMAGSAVAAMIDRPGAVAVECQPMIGVCLSEHPDYQAFLEVKTRTGGRTSRSALFSSPASLGGSNEDGDAPISVYLIVRRVGIFKDVHDLPIHMQSLASHATEIIDQVIVPQVLAPLRSCIVAGQG